MRWPLLTRRAHTLPQSAAAAAALAAVAALCLAPLAAAQQLAVQLPGNAVVEPGSNVLFSR